MSNQTNQILIPAEYKFINQVPEFQDDLPDNVYIDKTVTGCGITTAVLQNNVDYILAIPFQSLGDNKILQATLNPSEYPHEIFVFHSNIQNKENLFSEYLQRNKDKTKKIMVTYDSLNKLRNLVSFKDYKLFIDEGHKLLQYAGDFKPKVVYNLMDSLYDFKSFVIATATPNKEEFLPEKIKPLEKIKLKWSSATPLNINHSRLNQNQLLENIISIALNHKESNIGNAYIFVNSVNTIVNICKNLKKSFDFTSEYIKIICADNEDNQKLISKIGKGWKIKPVIEKDNPNKFYKINFITSTAFEGQDFLDPDGKTYIVSDGKLQHTKVDISTQVPQIAGRLRISKYKDEVNMIWTASPTLGITDEEEYKKYLKAEEAESDKFMKVFEASDSLWANKAMTEGTKTNPWIIDMTEDKNYKVIKNPDAYNFLMNTFITTEIQYYVNFDCDNAITTTENRVQKSFNEIFSGQVKSNLILPQLSEINKRKLGRKGNFAKLTRQYLEYAKDIYFHEAGHIQLDISELKEYKQMVDDLSADPKLGTLMEYIDIFGIDRDLAQMSDATLSENRLRKSIENHNINQLLKTRIPNMFEVGETYSTKQIKNKLESIYISLGIENKKASTGDLNLIFETKVTTQNKQSALKIIERK
jgi:hypothetical protein